MNDIIARSRSPGHFVERRQFTLSRDKAVEKLREFALRNPREYVLELVQAAVFSGATYIAVDVQPDRMLLAFVGGTPYTVSELSSIFDYLFADRGAARNRRLVQLAVGLNAVLQRKPTVLRIESGDGRPGTTVRMDLDKAGTGRVGVPEDALAGTYILAEFGGSWLSRFQQPELNAEAALIEERCLYTPVPILLNGRAPFGYKGGWRLDLRGVLDQEVFHDDERHGAIGVPNHAVANVRTGYRMVIGGVWITTLDLPELGRMPGSVGELPLTGVLCDDHLRKTADQSDIVRDARFARMMAEVQPHATRLIRRRRAGYVPPRLPAVAEGTSDAAEPLPTPIGMLGARGTTTVELLAALPAGEPVFWVAPGDASSLDGPADPLRFPYRVLVLTQGQLASLAGLVPALSVHRLGTAADVDFVRRVMSRQAVVHEASVPLRGDREDGAGRLRGRLVMRAHLSGPMPAWGEAEDGDVPMLVVSGGRTWWAGRVQLGLPGLSAVVEAEHVQGEVADGEIGPIAEHLANQAWRLVPEDVSPDLEDSWRPLVTALLASHARPHFVREPGTLRTRLDVAFPTRWSNAARRFASRKLAPRADGGSLTLADLVHLQGGSEQVALDDVADLRALHPLEERFGFGHLAAPELVVHPICGVVFAHGQWSWLDKTKASSATAERVLWLSPTVLPVPPGDGWHAVDCPMPFVGAGSRTGSDRQWDPARFLAGMVLLYRRLLEHHTRSTWYRLAPDGLSEARVRGVARVALLHMAGFLDRLDDDALLAVSTGDVKPPLRQLRQDPRFAVAPLHGPAIQEPATVLLTLDDLAAVERWGGAPLPLRFDDPPAVWSSLAGTDELEQADDPDWLVRVPVRIPGLRGWLGLRHPFDATTGVFLQSAAALVALPELDRYVPCHGLLWSTGPRERPSRSQRELLQLAALQLYQQLGALLDDSVAPERRRAAASYGTRFALHAWRGAVGGARGTALALARAIPVTTRDGKATGTLGEWLLLDPEERPALADLPDPPAPGSDHQAQDGPARGLQQTADARGTAALRDRVNDLLAEVGVRAAVDVLTSSDLDGATVEIRRLGADALDVLLDADRPLVRRAVEQGGAAADVLVLEILRRLDGALPASSAGAFDLVAVQQVLAARLVRPGHA